MSERSELNATSSDEELLRGIGLLDAGSVPTVEPPADLWNRISAAADELGDVDADASPIEVERPATVVDLASRRRRLPVLGAVAAAIVVVAIGFAVVLGNQGTDDDSITTVALYALVPDATPGQAELIADGDGFTLRVDAAAVPADGEFLELWLIDEGVTEPRSLGRFTGAGEYTVPGDVDPESVPIVDISTEPDDGDESHSGASVLRGALEL
ncbi:MAG: anti-sigma factor [Actinomycetota bacterium]